MTEAPPRMRYVVCWSEDDMYVALLKHRDDHSAAGCIREPEGLLGWSEADQRSWYLSNNVIPPDGLVLVGERAQG